MDADHTIIHTHYLTRLGTLRLPTQENPRNKKEKSRETEKDIEKPNISLEVSQKLNGHRSRPAWEAF